MRTIALAILLSVATAGCVFSPREPFPAPAAAGLRVSTEAHRILANLKVGKYAHVTRVDEATGLYEVDCSGLACIVLERAAPRHFQSLQSATGMKRLTARSFQTAFLKFPATPEGRAGWRQITRPIDVQPGDVVAWHAANPKPGSTGHVVIVDGTASQAADGVVSVPVIDSTPRRQWDTPAAKGQSGPGHRMLWLSTDAQGRLTGFRLSPVGPFDTLPVAIGRPVEFTD